MECKTHSSIFTDFLNDLDCERRQKIEEGDRVLFIYFFWERLWASFHFFGVFSNPRKTEICTSCRLRSANV